MVCDKDLDDLLNQAYRYALSLTLNENDAFDLVQNSYLKLVEKRKPLIISYFIITIRNQFIDDRRKQKVKWDWLSKLHPSTSYEPNFTVEPYLEKVLSELNVKEREIIFLSVVQEYTAQEISDLMTIPRGTVLSILHRMKLKMKNKLKEKSRE